MINVGIYFPRKLHKLERIRGRESNHSHTIQLLFTRLLAALWNERKYVEAPPAELSAYDARCATESAVLAPAEYLDTNEANPLRSSVHFNAARVGERLLMT